MIIYLNITKTFHLNSKNLPGEFYATTVPGFKRRTVPVNLIENKSYGFFKKCSVNRALFCYIRNSLNIIVIPFERGFSVNFGEAVINLDPTAFLCILRTQYINGNVSTLLLSSIS